MSESIPSTNPKEAVVTIQGGGLLGLSLLGQLHAVLVEHKIVPLAFAGNSAGAIVAALAWADLQPEQILERLKQLAPGAPKPNKLLDLLGEFVPPPAGGFDFQQFLDVQAKAKELPASVETAKNAVSGTWLGLAFRAGSVKKAVRQAVDLLDRTLPHLKERGFFPGDGLEKFIDEMLRSAPNAPKSSAPLLTFGDYADAAAKNMNAARPPLLLAATNLTAGRLEIISSIDPAYQNVPVAKAVRASAGFPGVFRPVHLTEGPRPGWFVDGGVVSNFPIWVFDGAFREELRKNRMYQALAYRPWIRIGLRVVEDAGMPTPDLKDPVKFYRALGRMLRGGARNELEELLTSRTARTIVVRQEQSATAAPPGGILAIDKLDGPTMDQMFKRGRDAADLHLRRLEHKGVLREDAATAGRVREALRELIEHATGVAKLEAGSPPLRCNVFLPDTEGKLQPVYQQGMDGDPDRNLILPHQRAGLTGFCYSMRQPMVCNLKAIRELAKTNPKRLEGLFGMTGTLHASVRADRTWLASMPIFDPLETRPGPPPTAGITLPSATSYRPVDGSVDGPIIGVLNLDAGWDYSKMGLDEDPYNHLTNGPVRGILALMQSASLRIGGMLIETLSTGTDE